MKNKKQKTYFQEIEKLLDSDDELPSTYNEEPVPPAYTNDNRFNPIVFKWINNPQMLSCLSKAANKATKLNKSTEVPDKDISTENALDKSYITSGYLSKEDLLCLKYVAGTVSDAIVLWFVDFLVHKDLQSKYADKFKSCLVSPCNNVSILPNQIKNKENVTKKRYKIVVKV